jgi:hypothetical protein
MIPDNKTLSFFEDTPLAVLVHRIPLEMPPIHGDVDPRRQGLHERQGCPQVKDPVGTAKGIRDHGAGEDDRLSGDVRAQSGRRLRHGVGTVGDDDPAFERGLAAGEDSSPAGVGHLEAVDHHERFDFDAELAAAEAEQIGNVGVLKKQLAGEFVVFLVERAAGDQDSDGVGWRVAGGGSRVAGGPSLRRRDAETRRFLICNVWVAGVELDRV